MFVAQGWAEAAAAAWVWAQKSFRINMQKAFQSCASTSHRRFMSKPEGWLMVTSSGGVFVEPGQGGAKGDAPQGSPARLLFTAAAPVSMAARHKG